jgi:hypothetical protein
MPDRVLQFVARHREATRFTVFFAVLWAGGALVFAVHGIAFHLTPWSQTIVNGVVKYGYPSRWQGESTVVLFREDNLGTLDERRIVYPVPYAWHAEVFRALAAYRPRAVFIDFAFMEWREEPRDRDALVKAICDLKYRGVRVYLPDRPFGRGDDPHDEHWPKLASCVRLVSTRVEPDFGVSGVLDYRACDATASSATTRTETPTPAFAILLDDVRDDSFLGRDPRFRVALTRTPSCPSVASGSAHHHALSRHDALLEPMEIIWGARYPRLNRWMNDAKTDRPPCPEDRVTLGRLWDDARGTLARMWHEGPLSATKLQCPYTQTISVRHLLGTIDPEVEDALQQKTVFYGAGFLMAGDILASPIHVEFPAVYLHAMAYDNLLTFGPNYKRADPTPTARWLDRLVVIPLVVLLILWPERPFTLDRLRSWCNRRLPAPVLPLMTLGSGLALAAGVSLGGVLWLDALLACLALLTWALAVLRWRLMAAWSIALGTSLLTIALACLPLPLFPWLDSLGYRLGWFAVLFLALAVAVCAILRLGARHPDTLPAPLRHPLLAAGLFLAPFLALAAGGLEAAALVTLGSYCLYKFLLARDQLFALLVVALVIVSLVNFFPGNAGPRNILALLLFFELARHLIEEADEVATHYFERSGAEPEGARNRYWRCLFSLCQRKESLHANRPGHSG